jgi:transcriptional regulator with XRE-family HTH domain
MLVFGCGRRQRRGMTLEVLAGLCGVSAAYISMIENGKRTLNSYSTMVSVANVLMIPPAELAPRTNGDDVAHG